MPDWFWPAIIAVFVLFAIFCFCMAGMSHSLAAKMKAEQDALDELKSGHVQGGGNPDRPVQKK